MQITKRSGLTGKVHTLDLPITQEQLQLYGIGMLVQEAFPDLDWKLREFLVTGITPEEYERFFGKG